VVQSTQDREGEDLATTVIRRDRLTIPFWNLLSDALMRPGSIEVLNIGVKDTVYGSAISTRCGSRDIVHQQAVAFIIDELDMGML
jgi:hypothetical protein